jgi:hypothetical protein
MRIADCGLNCGFLDLMADGGVRLADVIAIQSTISIRNPQSEIRNAH